ncbi:hypothetical protein K439DRAFT_123870 [Ramaria rubella]|nr:hypothetical protein K439DRAFT_123870 [Ramaria rubella]
MREDTELRWHGNRPPEDNTALMSIGEFFQMHYALPHASYFNNVLKQYAKIKGKHICLELWISEDSSLGLIQMQDERRGNLNARGQSWRRVISQNAHEPLDQWSPLLCLQSVQLWHPWNLKVMSNCN